MIISVNCVVVVPVLSLSLSLSQSSSIHYILCSEITLMADCALKINDLSTQNKHIRKRESDF